MILPRHKSRDKKQTIKLGTPNKQTIVGTQNKQTNNTTKSSTDYNFRDKQWISNDIEFSTVKKEPTNVRKLSILKL